MPELKIYRIDNFAGGLNLKNDPTIALGGIQPSQCVKAINCDFRDKVSIQSRDSYRKRFPDIYNANITGIFTWYKDNRQNYLIKTWDGEDFFFYDESTFLHQEKSDYFQLNPGVYNGHIFLPGAAENAENKKFDGTNFTKMGITAPATAPTVTEGAAGNLTGTYNYYYSYYNNNTGQESGLSPVAEITVSAKQVTVTPVLSSDPQVTHIRIYRAGGDAGPTVSGLHVKRRIDATLMAELTESDLVLGTNLITNGTFADTSWWTTTGRAAITGGVAQVAPGTDTTQLTGNVKRDYVLVADTLYQVKFDIEAITNGAKSWMRLQTKDPSGTQNVTNKLFKTGTYTFNFKASYQGLVFQLSASPETTTSLDNVSVKATTLTYTDNVADGSISTTAEDCSTNLVCPSVKMFYAHHHEMFGANNFDNPGYLYTSRWRNITGNANIEAFPGSDFIADVGNISDPIVAILPFEIDMIIYTERKVYRHRYLSPSDESSVALEEIAEIGCASTKTLTEGVLENGMPCHIFLGQSTRGRGLYLFDGRSIFCISNIVEPIFSGEREDISSINWNYVNRCCGAMFDNKYYLCYPEGAAIWPDKVLTVDFETMPPRFVQADFSAYAIHTDVIADRLYFGGSDKYLYEFSHGHAYNQSVEIDWQSPYFGDRATFAQLKSITLHANTRGNDLTVKVWVDRKLEATLPVQSSTGMERMEFDCPPACKGRLFSIELICESYRRVTISPPLELKVIVLEKY